MRKQNRFSFGAGVVILISTMTHSLEAADDSIVAGRYTIESQMVLPHMEEMRRIHKRTDTCIGEGETVRLFPIFHQPALIGCVLVPQARDGETLRYLLECTGVNGASGSATIDLDGDNISGELVAKMGGKNMTFSQFVNAERRGSCTGAVEHAIEYSHDVR